MRNTCDPLVVMHGTRPGRVPIPFRRTDSAFRSRRLVTVSGQERADHAVSTTIDVQPRICSRPQVKIGFPITGTIPAAASASWRQITPANVSQLRAQWVFHVREVERSGSHARGQ